MLGKIICEIKRFIYKHFLCLDHEYEYVSMYYSWDSYYKCKKCGYITRRK